MKKERTYLVLTNKAIELSNCQKEKMIEAYEKSYRIYKKMTWQLHGVH